MLHRKHAVLFTRRLKAQDIEYARLKGIEPTFEPALRTTYPDYWDKPLAMIAEHRRASWVFTSQKAVKALEEMMQNGLQPEPGISIYAVGPKTRKKLDELGLNAQIPYQHKAEALANLIIENEETSEVIYFRGNRSLQTIEDRLEAANITVYESEVYQTHLTEISIPERHFEGVVFYSPSAVDAFKKSGGFSREWPNIFAIGPTTAEYLEEEAPGMVDPIYPDVQKTRYLLNTISSKMPVEG